MITPNSPDAHEAGRPGQADDCRCDRVIRSEQLLDRWGRVIIEHKGAR